MDILVQVLKELIVIVSWIWAVYITFVGIALSLVNEWKDNNEGENKYGKIIVMTYLAALVILFMELA